MTVVLNPGNFKISGFQLPAFPSQSALQKDPRLGRYPNEEHLNLFYMTMFSSTGQDALSVMALLRKNCHSHFDEEKKSKCFQQLLYDQAEF